jgi:hypothetical protein
MNARLLLLVIASLAVPFTSHAADADPLVVHEWGTFTSVQAADGVQREWTASISVDLPHFVYSRHIRNGGLTGVMLADNGTKGRIAGFLRMETPVIYFYSMTEREVDVRVDFPAGRITEWYPYATRVGPYVVTDSSIDNPGHEAAGRSVIEWNDVKILAPDIRQISAGALIRDREDTQAAHYYAARETDANFLRVSSPHSKAKVEHERDLFYRGVGFTRAPLTVKMDAAEREWVLSTVSAEPLVDVFVLTLRQGLMRYRKIDRIAGDVVVDLDVQPLGAARDVSIEAMRDMATALVQQGLFAKEAAAMVKTWKDQWFAEEGTRVLYLLPRGWTDRILPLEISPQPDSIVRVMVGRAEVVVPSQERALRKHIIAFEAGDTAVKQQAVVEVRKLGLGRFLEPSIQVVLGERPDQALQQAAWTLAAYASDPQSVVLDAAQSAARK